MRRHFRFAVAAAAFIVAGCATTTENFGRTPFTPMTVAAWPGAPQGPFRAQDGERILTQYLTPTLVVTLKDDARPIGPGAPAAASAGATLFGVVDGEGATRFCAPAAGGLLGCFADENGDSAFDRAFTATAHEDFPLSVRRWIDSRALVAPAQYFASDPTLGPQQQIAIRYLGRSRDRLGFALQIGGADSFSDVTWTSRAAWLAPDRDGVLEFAGARLTILEVLPSGLVYSVQAAMNRQPVTVQVSTATRTLDSLVVLEAPSA